MYSDYNEPRAGRFRRRRWLWGTGAAVVVGLFIFGILALMASPLTGTDGGHVAVIRNGGWFDDREVNPDVPVLQPGSANTYTGWWSAAHKYPSSQRNFVVSSVPTADSNEVIVVPTKDSVYLGVEGAFFFELNRDPKVLTDFDNKYGTRTYTVVKPGDDPEEKYAWEDVEGWNAFLNFTIGKLAHNDLRKEMATNRCVDLLSTCALVQNNGQAPPAAPVTPAAQQDNITAMQEKVQSSFATEVNTVLGGPYFTNIKFVLAKVSLDPKVQDAVNAAQAAFGDTAQAQARLQAAQIDAAANKAKQDGYNTCPACAEQDNRRAIPPQITVWAPGGNTSVGVR